MALTELNNISIAEIVVYTPALLGGIFLAVRHGFGRNAGWLYLIVFSVARILGAALQLATIADPRNISLYVGSATLQTIGLSPLLLVQLALIARAVESASRSSLHGSSSSNSLVGPRQLRLVQIVVLVGLILGCIGGSDAGSTYAETGTYPQATTLSQAGIALMIVGYVLLVLATAVVAATQLSRIEAGERRVVLAVALSLPFILVRLAYSAESVFGANPDFNLLTGNHNVLLGMAVIMEMVVVAIVETIGLTLQVRPRAEAASSGGVLSLIRKRLGRRYGYGYEKSESRV
ncbi:hypothetical protein F5X96DRAFT_634234 [Biscogniauxia mediterranea]|nr:hypothetical protein F5X96DRAFT_634234 [Biscogniauxia mediterranea]